MPDFWKTKGKAKNPAPTIVPAKILAGNKSPLSNSLFFTHGFVGPFKKLFFNWPKNHKY